MFSKTYIILCSIKILNTGINMDMYSKIQFTVS